jgi:hypothetical protein
MSSFDQVFIPASLCSILHRSSLSSHSEMTLRNAISHTIVVHNDGLRVVFAMPAAVNFVSGGGGAVLGMAHFDEGGTEGTGFL